jgi:cell division transport system permease protein
MAFSRTDLPLERDSVGRFLPWLVAFMVYLSILALAGVLVLNAATQRWNRGLSGTLTVQLPPVEDGVEEQKRLDAVVALLRATPGVTKAEALPRDRLVALLEPWLGPEAGAAGMPIPRLIDVESAEGTRLNVSDLTAKVSAIAVGATIDDHRIWLERLVQLLRAAQTLAGGIVLLLAGTTIGTVIFVTRTSLAIHRDVIEVLHLIGAQDGYIAGQFASRSLTLGFRGGLIGLVLAAPTLLLIGWVAGRLEAGMAPGFGLTPVDWVALAALPVVTALIAYATARITVMRNLGAML